MRHRKLNTFLIFITLFSGVVLGALIGGTGVYYYKKTSPRSNQTLRVISQGEPIPKSILEQFLRNEKIAIQNDIVKSSNELLSKLNDSSHDYDLVILLSWQVPIFVESKLLQPIRKSLLTNTRYIGADFKHMPHDKDLVYSIPFGWGVNGLVYNSKRSPEKFFGWASLLKDKTLQDKVALLPDPRELMAGMIRRNSISAQEADFNSEGPKWVTALEQILPYIKRSPKQILKSLGIGEIVAGELSNGQASTLFAHSDDFKFVVPEESTTLWTISLSPCRGTTKEKDVHKFIDYLLKKEIALELASTAQFASPLVSLEYEPIPAMLKPSFIRTLPINRLQVIEPVSQLAKQWETTILEKTNLPSSL